MLEVDNLGIAKRLGSGADDETAGCVVEGDGQEVELDGGC